MESISDRKTHLSDAQEVFPKQWFIDIVVCQAHGHAQFTEHAAIPTSPPEHLASTGQHIQLKTHPIAQHVYFSGIAEMSELPHQSREALENYLQYQLNLKNNLQKVFNPKPL